MEPESDYAQDVVRCDMCTESSVEVTCETCQTRLCGNCVGKHITSNIIKRHDIAEFREKQPLLPLCRIHTNEKCDLFCKQCEDPICSQCVSSGTHKMHDFQTILEVYKVKKEQFQDEAEALEKKAAQEWERHISELEERISMLKEKYDTLTNHVVEEGKVWHDEVDVVVNSFLKNIEKKKTEDLSILLKNLEEFKNSSREVQEKIQKLYAVLKSADVNCLLEMEPSSKRFRTFPERFDIKPPIFTAKKRKIDDLFGVLSNSFRYTSDAYSLDILKKEETPERNLSENKTIASVDSSYRPLRLVKAVNNEEVWACGYDCTLKRFNMKGDQLDKIKMADSYVFDITVNSEGRIIFVDPKQTSVQVVINNNIRTLLKPQDWIPVGICTSSCGELIISMRKVGDAHGKIVRFSGMTPNQEIQFDENGKHLFLSCTNRSNLYIAENRNKDICVSDAASLSVMVVNEDGELRFKYRGKILASKMSRAFQPACLVTDSKGQILVADTLNQIIHIIDEDGVFVSYISCDFNFPTGLSISEDDSLFVAEYKTGKIKKIQYLS